MSALSYYRSSAADLYHNIDELEPAPGSVELLRYLAANRDLIGALLGPGGDQAFIKRIIDTAREAVVPRAQTGILGLALARSLTTTSPTS